MTKTATLNFRRTARESTVAATLQTLLVLATGAFAALPVLFPASFSAYTVTYLWVVLSLSITQVIMAGVLSWLFFRATDAWGLNNAYFTSHAFYWVAATAAALDTTLAAVALGVVSWRNSILTVIACTSLLFVPLIIAQWVHSSHTSDSKERIKWKL